VAGGPLRGVRVLDLATERAELAGRLLADLGAEVLKVEPPGGGRARELGPRSEGGESLYWAAVGIGKASLVVDLETAEGRERVAGLAARADVVIESSGAGVMEGWGRGYAALSAGNPGLVYVSVSPFGQEGPKAGWPTSELTIEAAGGRLSVQGDRDRAPIPIGYPQAAFHAGSQAACDVVIALNERDLSGRGQYLDLSMLEVMVWTLMDQPAYPTMTGQDPPGGGDDRGLVPRRHEGGVIRCADGWVVVTLTTGMLGDLMPSVLERIAATPPALVGFEWARWDELAASGAVTAEVVEAIQRALAEYFTTHSKVELLDWAMSVGLRLAPVQTTADVVTDSHLQAREVWQPIGEGDGRLYPRPPVRLSRTPARMQWPAPGLGELGEEMAARWLREELSESASVAPRVVADDERVGEAFAGLKVADFSWVGAGPMTGKAFADHGATVVRVESATRPDLLRGLGPFLDGVPGINRSQWTANVNSSKFSAAVNLGTAEGREVARRLIDWADVVIESFTPGTMQRLGLDYATVTRERDDLIMLSTCLLGQDGPRATYGGYGQHGAALSGLHSITGWPDRMPCGPHGPYTDVITPRYGVSTLAAAIWERRRSGLGQHIDLSQVEGAIQFIAPLMLDELWHERTAEAVGLGSDRACPHGVYATAGTERFIAIAVESAEQWRALLEVAPLDVFAGAAFEELSARQSVAGEIESRLAEWVRGQDAFVLEGRLASAGVPASVVQRMSDLHRDPQLASRGFFVPLEHSVMGRVPYDGLTTKFSAKRVALHRAGPALGEHTAMVMQELLGMSDEEVAGYAAAGALT